MNTSAPSMAFFRPPVIWRGLVTSPSQFLCASALLQPLYLSLIHIYGQNRAVCPAGNGVGQRLLGLLQFHDLFLNGVLRDQPVHLHRVALTDAVGAVGGLILRGKVPPLSLIHIWW